MVFPVRNNQNVSSQAALTPLTTRASLTPTTDTLRSSVHGAHNPLTSFCHKVTKFFKNMFQYFFGHKEAPPIFQKASTKVPPPVNPTPTTPTPAPMLQSSRIARLAARDNFVWFYKQAENPLTAFLGNFHPCQIDFMGMRFQCAEAAFQVAKFAERRDLMAQFQNLDGESAWRLAQQLTRNWTPTQHATWRSTNLTVMRNVLQAKFSQNPGLKTLLLATGNAYLFEHVPVKGRDNYWGDDSDGKGLNMLGRVLMETRGNLGGPGVASAPPINYSRLS